MNYHELIHHPRHLLLLLIQDVTCPGSRLLTSDLDCTVPWASLLSGLGRSPGYAGVTSAVHIVALVNICQCFWCERMSNYCDPQWSLAICLLMTISKSGRQDVPYGSVVAVYLTKASLWLKWLHLCRSITPMILEDWSLTWPGKQRVTGCSMGARDVELVIWLPTVQLVFRCMSLLSTSKVTKILLAKSRRWDGICFQSVNPQAA